MKTHGNTDIERIQFTVGDNIYQVESFELSVHHNLDFPEFEIEAQFLGENTAVAPCINRFKNTPSMELIISMENEEDIVYKRCFVESTTHIPGEVLLNIRSHCSERYTNYMWKIAPLFDLDDLCVPSDQEISDLLSLHVAL